MFRSPLDQLKRRDHLLNRLIEGDVRIVDDDSALGNDQWTVFALLVNTVTFGDLIAQALGTAPTGTNFLASVDINFVRTVGKDHGANVTPFHDQRADGGERTLIGHQPVANFSDARDQ